MGKIVIHDTADVTITDLNTGKVVLNAEAQLAQITGAISEEDLKGGIGNRKLYKIRTDKEVNLTMRSAIADVEYWAMTQGVTVDQAGVALVTEKGEIEIVENSTTLALEITALPTDFADTEVAYIDLVDKNGIHHLHPVLAGVVDLTQEFVNQKVANEQAVGVAPQPVNLKSTTSAYASGDKLVVFFQKEVVGKQVKIDSNKFSGKYKVEMRTIAYDLDSAQVTSDIYFIFPETIPAGEFDISLENGSVYTPEISFSVMNPIGNSEMGQIIEVARP